MSDTPTPATGTPEPSQSEIDVLSDGAETDETQEGETEETSEVDGGSGEAETASEEEDSEEEGEVEEEEETLDEDDETEAEITENTSRPSWQLIKEKYPELAKDKDFQQMYFRDQKLLELFPTVENARDASIKSEAFETLNGYLVAGNVPKILESIDQPQLEKLAENFIPSLYRVNPNLFVKASSPIIISLLHDVYSSAKKSGDQNLERAANHISRYLTGSWDLPNIPTNINENPEVVREREKYRQERIAAFRRDEKNFLTSADSVILRRIEQMVDEGLANNKQLTPFSRQAVRERTINDLKRQLMQDPGLSNKLRGLHRLAARDGFNNKYRSSIISASLERAKRLIPSIRNRHVSSALGKPATKGNTKIVAGKDTKEPVKTTSGTSSMKAREIAKKMSAEDFLKS